jgi:hypothetical protein
MSNRVLIPPPCQKRSRVSVDGLILRLTPHGRLFCEAADEAIKIDVSLSARLEAAFAQGSGPGLLQLGAREVGRSLPPAFVWWRGFAARYVAALCLHGDGAPVTAKRLTAVPGIPTPGESDLAELVRSAPMMTGIEYLTSDVLRGLWKDLEAATATAFVATKSDLQTFLKGLNPAWNLVGRVHFNLAENRNDSASPFAFMATYTTQLSAQGRARHVLLGQALHEYAGVANRSKLLALLMPVQRAAEVCTWLRPMVDSGEIYHPLRWTPQDAATLLASVASLESAGVVVRMPPTWRASRPPRPQVTATVGTQAPSKLGLEGCWISPLNFVSMESA